MRFVLDETAFDPDQRAERRIENPVFQGRLRLNKV